MSTVNNAQSEPTRNRESMRNVIRAHIEGRLLILPCKMGEPIYMIVSKSKPEDSDSVWFAYVKSTKLTKNNVFAAVEGYGKTVFTSKEEADAALEAMKAQNGTEEAADES